MQCGECTVLLFECRINIALFGLKNAVLRMRVESSVSCIASEESDVKSYLFSKEDGYVKSYVGSIEAGDVRRNSCSIEEGGFKSSLWRSENDDVICAVCLVQ